MARLIVPETSGAGAVRRDIVFRRLRSSWPGHFDTYSHAIPAMQEEEEEEEEEEALIAGLVFAGTPPG